MEVFPATLGGKLGTVHTVMLVVLVFMVLSLVTGLIIVGGYTGWDRKSMTRVGIGVSIPLVIIVGVLIGSYLYAPRAVSIGDDGMRIERHISSVFVAMGTIRAVRRAHAEDLRGSIRTFGVGGLFGSFGSYYSKALGSYELYSTNDENAVIVYADRIYVVTPDQPDGFVHSLEKRLGRGSPGVGV